MDAVEFLKALGRLCNNYPCGDNCPLIDSCDDESVDGYVRKVHTVEQWAKEHPVKTRQSEMLKMFPETEMIDDYICICPSRVSKEYRDSDASCSIECDKCKRDFWLKEIE